VQVVVLVVDGVLRDEYDAFCSVFERMHEVRVRTVGLRPGTFHGPGGSVTADAADTVWSADVFALPGSLGCERAANDPALRHEIERIARSSRTIVASSTGSILLAAAGVVRDEAVATHWLAGDLIGRYGCSAAEGRLVESARVITCSGALTALDAALLVADRVEGDGAAARIRAELLAAGAHHLPVTPWWAELVRRVKATMPHRRPVPSMPASPPPTPLSVMIELVDDPELVQKLRRQAARAQRKQR
jgi:putative intracellular protease/amidase